MKIFGKKFNSNIFSSNNGSHKSILPLWAFLHENTIKACSKYTPGVVSDASKLASAKFIVHTIRDFQEESPLLTREAESLFSEWDVISTSLIKSGEYNKTQWADVGLILAVPPQNIISTFQRDVGFKNHAGVQSGRVVNSYALADSYFRGEAKGGHKIPGGTYAVLDTPENILRTTPCGQHNEILIVGKSGVRIYEDFPATQKIRVCGIYYHLCVDRSKRRQDEISHSKNLRLINALLSVNPTLPVLKEITYVGNIPLGGEANVLSYIRKF